VSQFASYPSLYGRSVLITGGGSGIGAAITEAFVEQGAKVAFIDIDEAASRSLLATIGAREQALPPTQPTFIKCDLRDIAALRAAVEEAARINGPITVLVNNAARDDRHRMEDVTPEYWDERQAVNIRHQFFAAQAVFSMMKAAGGGSVINFGSVSWMVGQGGMPGYTTAKSAVMGLTRSLARDMGPFNIRVNSIAPGWIMTERQKTLWLTPEGEEELMRRQCLKRKLQPAEMARVCLFLAADDSSAMTNQTYVADGGWV
jgi:NAD(P)-dependent dehydrogenase (short-subunit alcohol dehydrogenase family)